MKAQLDLRDISLDLSIEKRMQNIRIIDSSEKTTPLTALMDRRKEHQKIVIFTRASKMDSLVKEWVRIIGGKDGLTELGTPMILPVFGKPRLCKIIPLMKKEKLDPCATYMLCKSFLCRYKPDRYSRRSVKDLEVLFKINFSMVMGNPTKSIIPIYNQHSACGYFTQRAALEYASIVLVTYPYMKDPLFTYLLDSMGSELSNTLFYIGEGFQEVIAELTEKDLIIAIKILGELMPFLLRILEIMKTKGIHEIQDFGEDHNWEYINAKLQQMDVFTRRSYEISFRDLMRPEISNLMKFIMARNSGVIESRGDRILISTSSTKILEMFDKAAFTMIKTN